MGRVTRLPIYLLYLVVVVLAIAAPLSASEEPPTPATAAPVDPAAPAPAPPTEAAPAEQTSPAAPAAPAVPPAQPAPAAAAPAPPAAPAAPAAPAEQPALRDEEPGKNAKQKDKPVALAAASTGVTISDFKFSPGGVTVNVGDTVTWSNNGPTAHSATANDGSFDTGILSKGGSGSHTFTQAGTFSYICTPHPFMKGTVTVVAASSGGGDTSGGDTGSTSGTTGTGSQADSGPSLPSTGMDVGGLVVLGLATLALGGYLRRRTAPEAVRPAGRIGW
jgi:LPXTG-motif cell wall-anchored protein